MDCDYTSKTREPKEVSVTRSQNFTSGKKSQMSRTKTQSLIEDISAKKGERLETTEKKKKQQKYVVKDTDDSDVNSDSEPSDDNLDQDQLLKLIPKKCSKFKYLHGIEEKKKKPQPQTEQKPIKKQKLTTMPCMSAAKKERDNKSQQRNNSETKKPVFKSVSITIKKGGQTRDVGT